VAKPNPRRTNGSRRSKLRARVAARGEPCAICGGFIDYSLPAGHPDSYELDEIIPVSKGGDPYDIENVQPAHRRCNRMKSNKLPIQMQNVPKLPHTRTW
jgi:5-methylcytosine-specific restriction endonuclease McrA